MNLNKIFLAYDVRGIYPQEVNNFVAQKLGGAYLRFLKSGNPKIIINYDGRRGSYKISRALISSLKKGGALVIDAGRSTYPMHNFIVVLEKAEGGIMITASHNPKKYNGFKICRKKAVPIGEKNGLKKIKALMNRVSLARTGGAVRKKNYLGDYADFLTKNILLRLNLNRALKIVIDSGNGMSALVIKKLFKNQLWKSPAKNGAKVKIHLINSKIDSDFPGRGPNPLIKGALETLKSAIKKHKADLGAAFDGDGDRTVFLDKKGNIVSSSFILSLFIEHILKKSKKKLIVFEPTLSKIVLETIKKSGGKPLLSKVGHTFIKKTMKEKGAILGGESSGHFYFSGSLRGFLFGNDFCFDAGIFALIKVIEIILKENKRLDELIKPYQKYFKSEEFNFKVKNKNKKMKEIENTYKKICKISKIDGISADCRNFWFNLRASNTEPLIRLNLEAKTKNLLNQKKKDFLKKLTTL